ncbi:MAG: glycosyltransferase family 2 protein [Chitinophagaceae bacterium]
MDKLSIIIPCFNEEKTIIPVLNKVLNTILTTAMEKEIIVVDDASTDRSMEIILEFSKNHSCIHLCTHEQNMGKGACIQTALRKLTGAIVIIQDADLEYDPKDYNTLLMPIVEGYADVVYGSRFVGNGPHRVLFYLHTLGNKFLTSLSNLFTQLNLTDMETGYKMFRREILEQINLREKRFGFEPEITAKVSRIKDIRIFEVGIAYYGRTYKEGKKITWKDGFRTIYCILKYNLFAKK